MARIDFIPLEYHEDGRRRRMIRIRSAGVCVLAAVMGMWVGVNRQMIASARAMLPEINAQQQQIDIHIARTQQLMADRATLDAHRAFLDQLQQRISLVPVLADISDRMPENVLLTQFSRSPELLGKDEDEAPGAAPALDLKGAKPNTPLEVSRDRTPDSVVLSGQPSIVTIRGVARAVPDILEFAAALERSKLIDRVEMQIGQPGTWAGKQVQRFEVTCALVPQSRSRK